jgi:hypothetical protein
MVVSNDKIMLEISRLQAEHRNLDAQIVGMSAHLSDFELAMLKRQKLQLKDQLLKLNSSLIPDILA